ncbi:23S rRNA (guanosine(2251)-2'-O)-methyltransferase RlmB [Candidatus Mycoplasma haematominutum]|uniref:RNA methyltransferase TrmH n=1 Tax=Candidatus Mycoplasma haematominutum 'Birmingham 1' TaxID=1116213 RepID=G8C2T0_9MOLU|nr:23S rRNA (guanosine(2251)-2'-O)-methyltransferase RlmB [Candidatus Mycoplasma haematominutum]CCE66628.1 RNA methyltransferase TrmH [Candidatus Mycoplasma haematominutum 'Birmingham 1']
MNWKDKLFLNGKKSVLEALQQEELRKLIANVFLPSSQRELLSECERLKVPYSLKSKSWLSTLQGETNSKYRDVFAFLNSKPQLTFQELLFELAKTDSPQLIVMVDKLQDSYNFGAILRTCVAAGVTYIIYSTTNNVRLNSIILKTSQGYALHANLIPVPNLANALEKLKKIGFWSYAASLREDSKCFSEVEFVPRSVLILGNEGKGISCRVEKLADWRVTIPLKNGVSSLNVSVAGGILIYEWVKQNGAILKDKSHTLNFEELQLK